VGVSSVERACKTEQKAAKTVVRSSVVQVDICDVTDENLHLELNTECCIPKDSKGFPKNITNNRGKRRYPDSKSLTMVLKTCDTSFLDFLRRCLV
jgi:hypothetical protein